MSTSLATSIVSPFPLARATVRAPPALAFGADDDAARIDLIDDAVAAGHDAHPRIARDGPFDAGTDERSGRAEEGYRLALHVRAHQRAVRVVVLQEGNQRRGHRDELVRRHVHQGNVLRTRHRELARLAAGDEGRLEVTLLVEHRVRLRDDVLLLLERRVELHLLGDLALLHRAVGRLDEAVFVDARKGRERRDEPDVRAFRRLDRADAPVVGRVDVAHLEPGALAGEAARAQSGEPPLVSDLAERIRLVHELREL